MSTQTSNGGGWMRPRGGTPLVGSPFLRLAGVSGALAVAMGAYGAHGNMLLLYFISEYVHFSLDWVLQSFSDMKLADRSVFAAFSADRPDLKKVYDTANFHHFVHTLALLAVPLCRRPALVSPRIFLSKKEVKKNMPSSLHELLFWHTVPISCFFRLVHSW